MTAPLQDQLQDTAQQCMLEYIVRLDVEPYSTLILALSYAEAYEIAYERWGKVHVLQISLCQTEKETRNE
jgi:hypothetical protein